MSIAPLLTKCLTAWNSWPGHEARLGQIVQTPSSGLIVGVPHDGHFAGGSGTGPRFLRRCAFAVGETTCGMTSPARRTITSSPSRTSLRRRSSSLCSVASLTTTPETSTGSSCANGTMWPVRPTFQATRWSVVVAVLGANFQAIAPRGSRPTTPSCRWSARSSTFTTTPSISKSSRLRRSSQAWHAASTSSTSSCTSTSRLTLKPCSASQSSDCLVRLELDPVGGADAVAPHRQRPRGGQLGVELADRPGRGVARVRVGRLAALGALLVQLREGGDRQVGLAAHLQQRRGVLDAQRDRADGAQVLGHVLADLAVPARRAAHQHAVLVDQRDRQAVDLRLGHEPDRRVLDAVLLQPRLHPEHPGLQLLLVARVRERQHRLEVAHLVELVERLRPHALGGRVRGQQVGVLGLEVAQLVEQRVVLGVRDLRVVEDVVAVAVVIELLAQLADPLLGAAGGGAHTSRAAGRSSRSRSKPPSASIPAWSVRSKWSGVTATQPSAMAAKSVPSSRS